MIQKKVMTLLMAGLLIGVSATAQKKKTGKGVAPPESVSAAFNQKYTNVANSKWSKNYSGNYIASFTDGDVKQMAEYNADGLLVCSKITYNETQVPETVTKAVADKYAGAAVVKECTRFELANVKPYYKVKIAEGTLEKNILMSEEGTIAE